MAIKAIIFDLDGTINASKRYYDAYNEYAISILSRILKISNSDVSARMSELRKSTIGFTRRVELMGVSRSQFYTTMAAKVPCKELIKKDTKLAKMLKQLRAKGYKLGLLTNTGRPLVGKILEALGISQGTFDIMATSTETELKPSEEPYIYIAKKLNVSLRDCAYVGDRYEMEIETAEKVGMTTIMLRNSMLEDSPKKGRSDYNIKSIYEIPSFLKAQHKISLSRTTSGG
ncbi:MAG: HAD family hydrolase [Thaumarchaeota archaeon]|nr:HAD family hydrolase [Nitrososphaerota archaeon]